MSPTPVTMASPTAPIGYSWEATSEQVAARYGLSVADIVRFDLNTAAAPPDVAVEALAIGPFEGGLSEYPPSDYRRLVAAAAARYGVGPEEILVGAGADEILDLIGKAFLPAGSSAVVPIPTYAMYPGHLGPARRAVVAAVPRLGADRGFALDGEAIRAAARSASVIWLCSPNNPTGLPEPPGTIDALLDGLAADARCRRPLRPGGRARRGLRGVRRHVASSGSGLLTRASSSSGPRARPTGWPACGSGSPSRTGSCSPRSSRIDRRARCPIVSVAVATSAFERDGWLAPRIAAIAAERERLAAGLTAAGWTVLPSVTNFLLVRFDSPAIAGDVAETLLRRGLVPRTFGAEHPLADHLRLTVRSPEQDDRLIDAARTTVVGGTTSGRDGTADPTAAPHDHASGSTSPSSRREHGASPCDARRRRPG